MLLKIGVLKNFVNSQENTCVGCCNFIKKRLQHGCFPVKFAKILTTPFSQNNYGGCFWMRRFKQQNALTDSGWLGGGGGVKITPLSYLKNKTN